SRDLGLKKTPKKSDRSAPRIDPGLRVDGSGRRRKELLGDVRSVAARNLANRQIKGFEHTGEVVLRETETVDKSAMRVRPDELGLLRKNPQPTVMQELRKRSVSSDGNLVKTLNPTPEKRDRSEPNRELAAAERAASPSGGGGGGPSARRELLLDVTLKANRRLSNSAIRGFEGVAVLREVDSQEVSDKSAPAVQHKQNGQNGGAASPSSSRGAGAPGKAPAGAKGAAEDGAAGKKAGILAAIIMILTCAACFSRRGRRPGAKAPPDSI
ncbi:MAG: hypothetical protein VX463_08355, partial [Pseudomonadota bacterium]|nr:hypothetical protein [Pseudomonadota bacterium]